MCRRIDGQRAAVFGRCTGHLGCGLHLNRYSQNLVKDRRARCMGEQCLPEVQGLSLPFEKISIDSWRTAVDSQMTSYCLCCREAAEAMRSRKRGSIINLGSTYGMVGPDFSIYEGTALTMPAAYAAIKGGIINFTRYLASYYAKDGIRFNCISPGGVENNQAAPFVENYVRKTPLGRMAKPGDIAGAAVFLASDASAYVTGHNLVVDGGWTAV